MTDSMKSAAERIQALRTAAEMAHQEAALFLAPREGQEPGSAPTVNDLSYRMPYAVGEMLTQLADHAEKVPTAVMAWAITVAEGIVESMQDDDGVARCRFCGCTENRACGGGCGWAGDDLLQQVGIEPMAGDVCTACAVKAGAGILTESAG